MQIADRVLGPGQPAWIVAEIGVNHDGDLDTARHLVDLAAEAGADAVKFQCFRADALASPDAPLCEYQKSGVGDTSQREMLRRLELSPADLIDLSVHAAGKGLVWFASPFDEESLEWLVDQQVPVLKLGSGELTNLPLVRQAARSLIPLVLSTGMASWEEIEWAVAEVRALAGDPMLLHCVTAYPTPPEEANVSAVHSLAERTGCPVGYSDHTQGVEASLAARALGACFIERHLTYDRSASGPDHAASLDGDGFRTWVQSLRTLESALGDGEKTHRSFEDEPRRLARKSIFADVDIAAGTRIEASMVTVRRPGHGLSPDRWDRLVGITASRDIAAGEPLTEDDIAEGNLQGDRAPGAPQPSRTP